MKVILSDPNTQHDYVDIVLYENLSYTEAWLIAFNYNQNTKWYRAAIAPEIYNPMRIPNDVLRVRSL